MAIFTPVSGGPIGAGVTLPTLPEITADMRTIYAATSLIDWWTADTGVTGSGASWGWIGRKGHNRLTPMVGTDTPTVVANSHNGRAGLVAGAAAASKGELADMSASLQPANAAFTWVYVGRNGGTSDAWLVAATTGGGTTQISHRVADNRISVNYNGPTLFTSGSAVANAAPHVGVFSVDPVGGTYSFRVNGTQISSGAVAGNPNTRLQVFERGTTVSNTGAGARLNDLMVFNAALHLAANASLLDAVEAHLRARYAV